VAGLIMIQACRDIDEKVLFNYPVDVVEMPAIMGNLVPEQMSDIEFPSTVFTMVGDTLMIQYTPSIEYFFSLINVNTGETISPLCFRGRGPGEMLSPAPDIDIYDGFAHVIDGEKATYYKIDIEKSLEIKTTSIVDTKFQLEGKNNFICYAVMALDDKLVCLDTQIKTPNELYGPSFFSVFDLKDGRHIADYHPFGQIPLKDEHYMKIRVQQILSLRCASNKSSGKICFAHYLTPQIGFLDCETGNVRGIRFGRKLKTSIRKPVTNFCSICSDEDNIYALFLGIKKGEENYESKLMVIDWEGNVRGFFKLDGPYTSISKSDSTLYLFRSDKPLKLFRMPLADVSATLSPCS